MKFERPSGAPPARGTTALYHRLSRMGSQRNGRRAVHLHFSRLAADNGTEHRRRIALTMFTSSLRGIDGDLFVLGNNDLVFIGRHADTEIIDAAIAKQRHLFKDDPVFATHDAEAGADDFASSYDLARDFDDVMRLVREIHSREDQLQRSMAPAAAGDGNAKSPLDLERLAKLEKVLSSADISNLVRQQAVCAVTQDMLARRVLDECFTSISDLERILSPGTDVERNRSLFQYLTLILDDRMLAYLKRGKMREFERYFSVNLNIATILSPAFLAFDSSLPMGARGTVVIELQHADVFADLRSYDFARDYIHDRGYRTCLDGVTRQSLTYVDRERLGVDFVKLHWSDDLACHLDTPEGEEIRRQIEKIGPAHVILHRCQTEEAVRFGQALGITMYQGHHIDTLLPLSERGGRSALDPIH